MKEEIKEISEYIDNRIIPNEKWNKIKDYIVSLQNAVSELTSQKKIMILKNEQLQQENEKLKENLCKNIVYERWYIHYKSKCEKANEFIEQTPLFEDPFGEGEHAFLEDVNTEYHKNLSNILNESDENETK